MRLTIAHPRQLVWEVINDPAHPLCIIQGLLAYFLYVPGIIVLLTGSQKLEIIGMPISVIVNALLLTLLFNVFIWVGYYISYQPTCGEIKGLRQFRIHVDKSALLIGKVAVATGFALMAFYIFINGGPMRLFMENRVDFQQVPNTGRYLLLGRSGIFAGGTLLLTAYGAQIKKSTDWKNTAGLFGVSLLLLITNVIWRSRILILFPMVVVGLIIHYRLFRFRWRHLPVIITGVSLLLVVFEVAEASLTGAQSVWYSPLVYRPRVENLAVILSEVPSDHPYRWGKPFLALIYPQIWDLVGIEVKTGGTIAEHIVWGSNKPNYSVSGTIVGYLYYSAAYFGIIFGGLCLGITTGIVRTAYINGTIMLGTYSVLLFLTIITIPTSVGWVVRTFGVILIPPLLGLVFLTRAMKRWVD